MKKITQLSLFTVTMLALPLFTGCGGDRSSDAMRHFLLETDRIGPRADAVGGNVCVKTFKISSPFDSSGFVYKKADNDYETDYYSRFITSPEILITQQCRNWLEKSGIFENVLNASSIVSADYILEGNIISLYGDFAEVDSVFAVMQIRFVLIKQTEGEPVIVFSKCYTEKIEVSAASPEDIVAGYDKCLVNIMIDFEKDVNGFK